MRFFTRLVVLCVCGAFFSALAFGRGGEARFLRTKLDGVNFTKHWAGKIVNSKAARLVIAFIAAGTLSSSVNVDAADGKKTGAKVEKLFNDAGGEAKIELGRGFTLGSATSAVGNLNLYTDKDDLFTAGVTNSTVIKRELLRMSVNGSAKTINTKRAGHWSGEEDYDLRGLVSQGFRIPGTKHFTPNIAAEGGFNQLGGNKRLVDATAGIGFSANGKIFGKPIELQVRGGAGTLGVGNWNAMMDEFESIDASAVSYVGVGLNTSYTSLSEFLGIDPGSILDYVPVLPSSRTDYRGYRQISGDNDVIHDIKTAIDISKQLGLELGYNKVGDQEPSKYGLVTFKVVVW